MSGPHGIVSRGAAPPGAADVLSLVVGNKAISGWQRVAVTRSLDTVPASFDCQVTERYPNTADVLLQPGEPCRVMIGGDLVITGFVDRYTSAISANDHTVRINGRSKSADLVDCSAFLGDRDNPGFQVMGGTALSIAQQLARPYGVEISSLAGNGADIPRFNINLGETPWEIIDRLTRISKLIAYDLPDGSIIMAQAGSERMASGFEQGKNVEQAAVSFAMDERFSEYIGHLLSTFAFNTQEAVAATRRGEVVKDEAVARFRRRYIISEQSSNGRFLAHDRTIWERNRRLGRSQAVNITCDAWRDGAGKLWAPNHLATIRLPVLKLADASWLIAQVTYLRDEAGQHARLTLMPTEAFSPEPVPATQLPVLVDDVEAFNATRPMPG